MHSSLTRSLNFDSIPQFSLIFPWYLQRIGLIGQRQFSLYYSNTFFGDILTALVPVHLIQWPMLQQRSRVQLLQQRQLGSIMIGGSSPSSLPPLVAYYEKISFHFPQRPHFGPTWLVNVFSLVVPGSTSFSYNHCPLNRKIAHTGVPRS